jgi:hypothetical protein
MNSTTFAADLAKNRAAYVQFRERIQRAKPGQYAAIAQGRLIAVTDTFDMGVAVVQQLKPAPEHFLVFPVDEEPAFDLIDDFFRSP